ncbi:unnamed protein product [Adineta ricciae]|uniref:SAM domain-containing protein n=1 Tax=Adineta ricciae TaxID=249248 RepID=A0A813V5J4_ADIRI|nr:unnamed protein product [Adineta ricciae]CAF1260740.1 unnamed protein product [Adineta ricciae]
MANWTVGQVNRWLKENGFKRYMKRFQELNINGNALIALTDEQIVDALSEFADDGTTVKPTIGAQSRFREKLRELKKLKANSKIPSQHDENQPTTVIIKDKKKRSSSKNPDPSSSFPIKQKLSKTKHEQESDSSSIRSSHQSQPNENGHNGHQKSQYEYPIDNTDLTQFFENQSFVSYVLGYVKEKTISIPIDVKKALCGDAISSTKFVLHFTATEEQYQTVVNFIEKLFQTVQIRTYKQQKVKKCLSHASALSILQRILDHECQMFTICRISTIPAKAHKTNAAVLEIVYFDDDEFNNSHRIAEIDDIIENHISQERLFLSKIDSSLLVEYFDVDSCRIIQQEKIYARKEYQMEFDDLIAKFQQKNKTFVTITKSNSIRRSDQTVIDIFGKKNMVNSFLSKVESLFRKYRVNKYKFSQLSTTEIDCLIQIGSNAVKMTQKDLNSSGVRIDLERRVFYAPPYLSNDVESRLKTVLSSFNRLVIDTHGFYYDIAEKAMSHIEYLAKNSHCYCKFKLKKNFRSFPMLRRSTGKSALLALTHESTAPLPFFACEAKFERGAITVSIADITDQQADVFIIPSLTSGLKEHLIERAGHIEEQPSKSNRRHQDESMPFITETSAGRLNCKKILFVNWSLPGKSIDEDLLCESVRTFVSHVIQYILKAERRSNRETLSIAIVMPDSIHNEQTIAEEMIDETLCHIRQVNSTLLNVSFIFLPDQQNLYKHFVKIVQPLQTDDKTCGYFYCPTSTATVTLIASNKQHLTQCEQKINHYLERSMCSRTVYDFTEWDQDAINGFYSYCRQISVLPQMNEHEQLVLFGPITNVNQAYEKYRLTHVLMRIRGSTEENRIANAMNNFKIVLSYALEDSRVCEQLRTHLVNEGFFVWMRSDSSDKSSSKIERSNLVILCLSENYFRDQNCIDEARCAYEKHKSIIPIKVEYCQPIRSLRQIIDQETCFSFFGSREYFNLQFDRLLLKIFQNIRSSQQREDSVLEYVRKDPHLNFLLIPKQRRSIYEEYSQKLMKFKRGRIQDKERRDLIKDVQDMIEERENLLENAHHRSFFLPRAADTSDPEYEQRRAIVLEMVRYDFGISSLKQWIDGIMQKLSKLNLHPFTYTGDINDAPFPVLDVVLQNSYLSGRVSPDSWIWNLLPNTKRDLRESARKAAKSDKLKNSKGEKTHKDSVGPKLKKEKVEDSKRDREPKKNIARGSKSQGKNDQRGSSYSKEQLKKYQSEFAKRMRQSWIIFEKVCREYKPQSRNLAKEKTKINLTAIFTPCPFSSDARPRKALKTRPATDLPLKFVWNGVQDDCNRKSLRNNTLCFFSYEQPVSLNN